MLPRARPLMINHLTSSLTGPSNCTNLKHFVPDPPLPEVKFLFKDHCCSPVHPVVMFPACIVILFCLPLVLLATALCSPTFFCRFLPVSAMYVSSQIYTCLISHHHFQQLKYGVIKFLRTRADKICDQHQMRV